MKIVVTGATGFVGRHLVAALLSDGHEITAVASKPELDSSLGWNKAVDFVQFDLNQDDPDVSRKLGVPDALVHLAWPGLPNYLDQFHIERNLPSSYVFIKRMVEAGTKQVLVTGTCFEYGMQNGALSETTPALPKNPYGLAKHALRLFLQSLQESHPFTLQWSRLFYLHGAGQNRSSVLSQLDRAIDEGQATFKMSGGEQLRDYLPVKEAAAYLAGIVNYSDFDGIVNCCSGKPISVRRLVEERILERGAQITPVLGHFPYPDYEPFAFWGVREKLSKLLELPDAL